MEHPQPQDRRYVNMRDAAKLLEIGRNRLFALLRRQGVLDPDNRPRRDLVDSGYFRLVIRQRVDNYNISHPYTITLVSGAGLTLLRQIIDDHGEKAPALRRRDPRPDPPRGPQSSAGADPQPPARLGSDTGQ